MVSVAVVATTVTVMIGSGSGGCGPAAPPATQLAPAVPLPVLVDACAHAVVR